MMKKWISLLLFCLLALGVCCAFAQEVDGGCVISVDQQLILSTSGKAEHAFVMTADQEPAYYRIDVKNEDIGANVKLALYDQHELKMDQVSVYTQKSDFISWKAEPGARYALVVSCTSDKASGRVSLLLSKAPDLYADELENAGAIPLDETVLTTLDGTGDKDWLTFTAEEGNAFYRVDLKNEDIPATLYLQLYDENGLKMERISAYKGNSAFLSWAVTPGSTYSLCAYTSSEECTGRYTLTLTRQADREPNAIENAMPIDSGAQLDLSLDGTGDKDWMTFTAEEGGAFYRVDLKNEDIPATLYLQLYDKDGLKMERINVYKGKTEFLSWAAAPGSTYSLCAYTSSDECTGRYMLTLTRQADHEPNAIENAMPIDGSAKLDLSLDGTGDQDWMTFTAEEGEAFYRVDLKNEDIPTTVYLQLYDKDGLKMERIGEYKGKTASFSWAAVPGSDYYLCAYAGSGEYTGRYTLELSRQADNEAGTLEQAAEMPVGQTVTASFDGTGDQDIFKLTASDDAAYYQVDFTNEMDGSRVVMQLLDASGLMLEKKDAGQGAANALNWQPEPGAVYYLQFAPSNQHQTGPYTFTLRALEDPEADTMEEAGALEEGRWEHTLGSAADADWFSIGSESSFVQLTVSAGEQGSIKAHLYDQAGKELQSWRLNAGNEKAAVLTVDSASTHYLRITGEKACDYVLQRADEADLGGSSTASALRAAVGQTVLHFEMADDADYIALEPDMTISLTAPQDTTVYAATLDAQGYVHGSEQRLRSGEAYVFAANEQLAFLRLRGSRVGALVLNGCTPAQHAQEPAWTTLTEASCIAEGLKEQRCLLCGELLMQEAIPAAGHSAGEMKTAQEATCTEEGVKEQHCTVCGELLMQEAIPALGHTDGEMKNAQEATCTEEGVKEQHCTVCGELLMQEAIPAAGHSAGEMKTAQEATCTEEGLKEQHCTVCGELLAQEAIPALGHTAGEMKTAQEATCTEEGVKEQHCTVCGELLMQEGIPALGHQYGEWIETKAPTRSEEGTETQTCYRCEGTQERSVPKLTLIESIFGR